MADGTVRAGTGSLPKRSPKNPCVTIEPTFERYADDGGNFDAAPRERAPSRSRETVVTETLAASAVSARLRSARDSLDLDSVSLRDRRLRRLCDAVV